LGISPSIIEIRGKLRKIKEQKLGDQNISP